MSSNTHWTMRFGLLGPYPDVDGSRFGWKSDEIKPAPEQTKQSQKNIGKHKNLCNSVLLELIESGQMCHIGMPRLAGGYHSSLFMKPNKCNRLVNRLKMDTNRVTVAMM